ncbi:MAG: F0F1 ATP synthase subunit delta [Deltaproteobacteria bacterium]|nr:F0F1 ATP synthase subunit delta [Deltaproteobacteria bacterium]
MTSLIVAKRYARALLEIGKEDGNLEQYGRDVASFAELLTQAPELDFALSNPAFDLDDRKKLLGDFLKRLELGAMVQNFFRLLMDRGRINGARDIAIVYAMLMDEEKGITRAEVVSATQLDEAEVRRLTDALKKVAGRDVQLEVKEDPSLIGGVVAKIGDLVLDGSVKSQLESLKESLRRGDYA